MTKNLAPIDLLLQILSDLIVIASVLSFACYLIVMKRILPHEKIMGLYIFVCMFFELLASMILFLGFSNNLPGLHLFTLVQFLVLALFFGGIYRLYGVEFPDKLYISIVSVAIILNSVFVQSIYSVNSISKTTVDFIIIIQSIFVFILVLKKMEYDIDTIKPAITFTTAIFLDACVSFIYFVFSNHIYKMSEELSDFIWLFRAFVNILTQILFIFTCYQIYKRWNKNSYQANDRI